MASLLPEQIGKDKAHAVCLQRPDAGRASAPGTAASAELLGSLRSKQHWCHRVLYGMQPQQRQLGTVSAFPHLSTAWPLARVHSFQCHQKTQSVNRCGWAGKGQETNTISTHSWHKQTSHTILFEAWIQEIAWITPFLPRLACWIQAAEHIVPPHPPASTRSFDHLTESAAIRSAPLPH